MAENALHENYRDLTTGRIGEKLIRFALPVIAANLLQALYSLVDMAIVGRYNMAAGMSAVNLGGAITQIILVIAVALTNGGSVVIGQLLGAKRKEDAVKASGTLFGILFVIAVVLTAVTLVVRVPLLRAMKTTEEAFNGAVAYLTICASGTVMVYIFNANSAVLRAAGESVQPLIAVAGCAVINLVLDLIMVGRFGMGPAGAAYATVISQIISAVLTTIFVRRLGLIRFKADYFSIDKRFIKSMMKIALPFCLQLVLVTVSFAFVNSLINELGTSASAAAGAVSKLGNFATLPPQSVMSALMALTAQNLGANNIPNIKQGFRTGAGVGIGVTVIICCIIWAVPGKLIGMMTPDNTVAEVGAVFFRWVAVSYIFESVLFVLYGILMGAGYTNITLLCGVLSSLVLRYTLAWTFIRFTNWGFSGIGVAYSLAALGAMLVAVAFYWSGRWTKPRVRV
jgi:putative MATE family efflux protein